MLPQCVILESMPFRKQKRREFSHEQQPDCSEQKCISLRWSISDFAPLLFSKHM